ncbi:MAG: hypothetical protein AB1714_04765 [Acidobacteriota bacterium]
MVRTISAVVTLAILIASGAGLVAAQTPASGEVPLLQLPDQERVEKCKQIILSRVTRDKVTFRGDKPGQMRIRWEWYDKIVKNYIFEKTMLLRELSANEKHQLRPEWAYKGMKVTFQELFQLGPNDDDKLLPILSHQALLNMIPKASLQGVTLLGKQGELKGPFTRKYKVPSIYLTNVYETKIEYRASNGSLATAFGLSYDAFTLRWKDIKDRVVDEVSDAKEIEDLQMVRDAENPAGADRD